MCGYSVCTIIHCLDFKTTPPRYVKWFLEHVISEISRWQFLSMFYGGRVVDLEQAPTEKSFGESIAVVKSTTCVSMGETSIGKVFRDSKEKDPGRNQLQKRA